MTDSGAGGQLWGGRFSAPPAPEAHALGRSLRVDIRMVPQDVAAGQAHVQALRDAGLVSDDEAASLVDALTEVGRRLVSGDQALHDADEDVHSAVERAVTDELGSLGSKLHAGRSRNDLVATDLRLWLLEAGRRVDALIGGLCDVLLDRAEAEVETVMPGTTHGRPAQPVTLGHHLLAHAWALSRDRDRVAGWADRASVSALGAGALATSTLGLDPVATASRLGMDSVFGNSIDAVSDRDFVQEWIAVCAICATHLSRLAADLARWIDPTLGWAQLAEAYATGSSMMPQKRNPDTLELARGKAARIAGGFVTLAALLQGLPLGYHRDLQEDKEPAFDAADTLRAVLPALIGALRTMRFDRAAMRAGCDDDGLFATDLAEALVRRGVPFREAHHRTGALLKDLEASRRGLGDLSSAEWAAFGVEDGASYLDPQASVARRTMPGGPSRLSVLAQIATLRAH